MKRSRKRRRPDRWNAERGLTHFRKRALERAGVSPDDEFMRSIVWQIRSQTAHVLERQADNRVVYLCDFGIHGGHPVVFNHNSGQLVTVLPGGPYPMEDAS